MNMLDEAMRYLASLKSGQAIEVYDSPVIPLELLFTLQDLGYLKAGETDSGVFRWIKQ